MAHTKNKITRFSFKPGKLISDKYEIVSKVGAGWEGEVYIVKEKTTNIERAIKFFFPHRNKRMLASKGYAKKLYKLRDCSLLIPYHSHEVIQYRDQKVAMLVSDFVEGEVLPEFLKRQRRKRLGLFQGVHFLHALAKGLEEIHLRKEYHGDLHAENIIIKRHGLTFDLKVIDFFSWSDSKKQNMQDDLCDTIKVFYDSIGGKKAYAKHPKAIKDICCGLKRSIILKKYKNLSQLRSYLESLNW